MSSSFNIVKKPKKDEDEFEEELENVVLDEDKEKSSKSSGDDDPKKRLFLLMGVLVGGTVILLLILALASMFNTKKLSYSDIEKILEKAAVSYFKDHPDYLPAENGNMVEVDAANFVAEEKMKDLSTYTGDVTCSGKVVVENSDGEYLYTPYLNCGDVYTTYELYNKVFNDNEVVSSGDGLYHPGSNYVFRGEKVNNYVQLGNSLWRIVKINSNNNIVLISESGAKYTQPWDNRYNESRFYESGISDYSVSRIKEFLEKIYTSPSKDDGEDIIAQSDKAYMVSYSLCVGKRELDSQSRDNTLECKKTINNQRLGLLTLSDYLYASLDPNCKSASNKSCQNYNYLAIDKDWWLVTADSKSTSTVFKVDQNGVIKNDIASTYALVRPVIYLNSKTMYKSGSGTLKKPYTIK